MARTFMPKSGTMMPYIVLNRDAAVAGVFTVDGDAGSIDLTGKYLQITDANNEFAKYALKGSNNDITNLTALTGSLKLGADGTESKHATTLSQMNAAVANVGVNNYATANNGDTVYGGDAKSVLKVNNIERMYSAMRIKYTVGGDKLLEFRLVDGSVTDYFTFTPNLLTIKEATGTGSNNNRTSAAFRVETAQSFANIRSYKNSADGGLIFAVSQDGNAAKNFYMTGVGNMTVPGTAYTSGVQSNGEVAAWTGVSGSPGVGAYLNAASVKSRLEGRGAYADPRGAIATLYVQEYVGNYHSAILGINGFNSDRSWAFRASGALDGPLGSASWSGSDVRLKDEIVPANSGAGERVDKIGVVEFRMISTGEVQRGFIAQQLDSVDHLYTFESAIPSAAPDTDPETIMNVRDRAILADVVAALQDARTIIKELTEKVAALENK